MSDLASDPVFRSPVVRNYPKADLQAPLVLSDYSTMTKISIRADAGTAAIAQLDVPFGRTRMSGPARICGIRPDEWWVIGDHHDVHAVTDKIDTTGHVSLIDLTHGRCMFRVTGADAAGALDHLHSRDLQRLSPGQSAYGAVLTADGKVADDAIAFNNGDAGWLFVHGSGASMELLADSAKDRDVSFSLDDDLHTISVQGPQALEVLNAHTADDLAPIGYFHHIDTELFGHPMMVSRTGYSGERGYELFLPAAATGPVWDALVDTGVMPASFAALDKVRVEAGLLFYGYDMTDEHFPSEVGLGWAISKNGADYRGKAAALAAMGSERFVQAGLVIDHDDALVGGETVRLDGADVGTLNSPVHSHRMQQSLALGHVAPSVAPGTSVEVVGDDATYQATVEALPFYDPEKTRTHA